MERVEVEEAIERRKQELVLFKKEIKKNLIPTSDM